MPPMSNFLKILVGTLLSEMDRKEYFSLLKWDRSSIFTLISQFPRYNHWETLFTWRGKSPLTFVTAKQYFVTTYTVIYHQKLPLMTWQLITCSDSLAICWKQKTKNHWLAIGCITHLLLVLRFSISRKSKKAFLLYQMTIISIIFFIYQHLH